MSGPISTPEPSPTDDRYLIPVDEDGTYGWKAEECLRRVNALPHDDLAKPELLAAAQTFALLEISARMESSGAGYTLADAVCHAGGVQP